MTLRITAIFFILINAVLAGTPIKHSFLGVSKGGAPSFLMRTASRFGKQSAQ